MSYDPACHDLAEQFLSEYDNYFIREGLNKEVAIGHLAQRIQTAIEDWFSEGIDA